MYNEVRFNLNNTNTKWISIGVYPEDRDEFSTAVFLKGEKNQSVHLWGMKEVLDLFMKIRGINYFAAIHVKVCVKSVFISTS